MWNDFQFFHWSYFCKPLGLSMLDDFLARDVFSGQEVIEQSPLLPYVCPVLLLGLLLLFNLILLYFVTFLVLAPSLFWIYVTWEQISPLIKQDAWETLGIPFMFTEYAAPCIKNQTIRWLFEDSVLWNSFPPRQSVFMSRVNSEMFNLNTGGSISQEPECQSPPVVLKEST